MNTYELFIKHRHFKAILQSQQATAQRNFRLNWNPQDTEIHGCFTIATRYKMLGSLGLALQVDNITLASPGKSWTSAANCHEALSGVAWAAGKCGQTWSNMVKQLFCCYWKELQSFNLVNTHCERKAHHELVFPFPSHEFRQICSQTAWLLEGTRSQILRVRLKLGPCLALSGLG